MCAVVPADSQSKTSVDPVAIEQHTLLRQVALCYLLTVVDLPFLDGIANGNDSAQTGWPSRSCSAGFKLSYENPLFASARYFISSS